MGGHPFQRARAAISEAIGAIEERERLAAITGPKGPGLAATELHPTIWGAAATLWDDGHPRQAVQAAAAVLEAKLQAVNGGHLSGAKLAQLFSVKEPSAGFPRLRIREIDFESETGQSAHMGTEALIRASFMAVRNLVSHPGWPDLDPAEALEMLAVLSYVARMVDRSDVVGEGHIDNE